MDMFLLNSDSGNLLTGRRDEIHNTFGAKRIKLDYGNQNARVNPGKDPFSFETDPDNKPDVAPPVVKPKKFFKSRNVSPAVEESRQDVAMHRQVPDSNYGRTRTQKTPPQPPPKQSLTKVSSATTKKVADTPDLTNNDTTGREEGKPPIVLRICKGTARLVCGNVQNSPEPEPDTYRISTPLISSTKVDIERKNFSADVLKSEPKAIRSNQPIVSTVSIPLENSEMRRTTRSRAKNLHLDLATSSVVPTTPVTANSHSSGLSLTLRKSVTDSNNTLISHYDIVKTDCSSTYPCKPTIEPLIGRDQPLPTTTQELIDILSSDSDPMQTRPMIINTAEIEENTETVQNEIQHCSIDLPTSEVVSKATTESEPEANPELESEVEQEPELDPEPEPEPVAVPVPVPVPEPEPELDHEVETEQPTRASDSDAATAKTLVDQDWFSGSDDSEGVSGNTENDIPLHVTSTVTESQPPNVPSTTVQKPATKKGSIFKSRSTGATNGNKRRALYKHKWCDSDKESNTTDTSNVGNTTPTAASGSHSGAGPETYEEEFDPPQLTRVVKYPEADVDFEDETEAITSIRCGKKVKGVRTFG